MIPNEVSKYPLYSLPLFLPSPFLLSSILLPQDITQLNHFTRFLLHSNCVLLFPSLVLTPLPFPPKHCLYLDFQVPPSLALGFLSLGFIFFLS